MALELGESSVKQVPNPNPVCRKQCIRLSQANFEQDRTVHACPYLENVACRVCTAKLVIGHDEITQVIAPPRLVAEVGLAAGGPTLPSTTAPGASRPIDSCTFKPARPDGIANTDLIKSLTLCVCPCSSSHDLFGLVSPFALGRQQAHEVILPAATSERIHPGAQGLSS